MGRALLRLTRALSSADKGETAMKATLLAILTAFLLFELSSGDVLAQQPNAQPKERESTAKASPAPVYKPPLRGAPGGRVGGGTRGAPGRDIFVLSVLAPDHTGLTMREQPSLFWFISSDTSLPVEVTVSDPNATEPLLETRIAAPVGRGVHRVRLADHNVRLAAGVAYQWAVTVIPDAARRSRDILASGTIERVEPSGELGPKLAAARNQDLASVYAEAGIWYDALEAVTDLIERSPGDAAPREYRAALLVQAGLPQIAE
jgi:hypothetical protein